MELRAYTYKINKQSDTQENEHEDDPGLEVSRRVNEYLEDHRMGDTLKDYKKAQAAVFAEDPELKQRYAKS